jgi:hypothetical protein
VYPQAETTDARLDSLDPDSFITRSPHRRTRASHHISGLVDWVHAFKAAGVIWVFF